MIEASVQRCRLQQNTRINCHRGAEDLKKVVISHGRLLSIDFCRVPIGRSDAVAELADLTGRVMQIRGEGGRGDFGKKLRTILANAEIKVCELNTSAIPGSYRSSGLKKSHSKAPNQPSREPRRVANDVLAEILLLLPVLCEMAFITVDTWKG